VDRYCIADNDESEKHAQIKNMGLIYTNAEAIVVAAAGPDSSFGLPGAGYRKRQFQRQARIGKVSLCSTMPDPKLIISGSKWMTRAWTYQEGALSSEL
jgi:Heterokaryon incompatibility protein (HET)